MKSTVVGPRNYDSVIPLIKNFDGITDLKLKGEAAFFLGHYYLYVFDGENSIRYFSIAQKLFKSTGEWGLYLDATKDYCNASRMTGRYSVIEPSLLECLRIARTRNVGYHVLNSLQELMVHYAYTEGKFRQAIRYGQMFMDTLHKYEALKISGKGFEFNRTMDAKIVELELGHSYLMTGDLAAASRYLRGTEQFFLQRKDHEKLSRLYRHLAFLKGVRYQKDSISIYLAKFDQEAREFNRQRSIALFTLPRLTRDIYELNTNYQKTKAQVAHLTKQNYYTFSLLLLALVLGGFAFWWQRKSRLNQMKINALLRRDFERSQELHEEKSRYFSILSHELRTPIFAITGLARLLDSPEGNTKENVSAIINSGNHLLHLVNNVLQHNKLEDSAQIDLEETDFELVQTIQEVLQTTSYLAGQKNIEVLFQNDLQEAQFLSGDKQKLSQILVNLISNSIRYSYRDGKVEVSVRRVGSGGPANIYEFSIRDYGVGIDELEIPYLFDFYKTAHKVKNDGSGHLKGMGIGLFVVASFIRAMGSRVAVKSAPGAGSVFYFELAFKRATAPTPPLRGLRRVKKDVSILVVDDIKINLLVTQKTLQAIGINCITATDADPVIDIIREQHVDLVLMDLNMPSIDGYELSKNIRQAGFTLPIIAHTAVVKENIDTRALRNAEIQDFLVKPYAIEDLKEKLVRYLNLDFEEGAVNTK